MAWCDSFDKNMKQIFILDKYILIPCLMGIDLLFHQN